MVLMKDKVTTTKKSRTKARKNIRICYVFISQFVGSATPLHRWDYKYFGIFSSN